MKRLEAMTVAELRQHARAIGLSSVTRLDRRASLVAAIRRMQQRHPHRYPPAVRVTEHLRHRAADAGPDTTCAQPATRPAWPSRSPKQTPSCGKETPAMPLTVRIGYTISDRDRDYVPTSDGYRPAAAQRSVTVELPDRPELARLTGPELAEAVFVATNAPEDRWRSTPGAVEVAEVLFGPASNLPDEQRRHLRALSVGDTVTVAGRTLACEPVGFTDITGTGA